MRACLAGNSSAQTVAKSESRIVNSRSVIAPALALARVWGARAALNGQLIRCDQLLRAPREQASAGAVHLGHAESLEGERCSSGTS
jgi:hypothetical protein